MGIFYLFLSKLGGIGKMIAMKKCGKIASGPKNSLKINSIRSAGCVVVSLIICLFSGFRGMDGQGFFISLLSGISNAALLFLWVLCAEKCSLCTVEIFCMMGGVVLPLMISPLLFVGESVSVWQWIGALMLLPAAYCFSSKEKGGEKKLTAISVVLLICACIANAGCVTTQKVFTYKSLGSVADFNLLTFLFCTLSLGIAFVCIGLNRQTSNLTKAPVNTDKKQIIIYIIIAIIMLYGAQYFSTLASSNLSSAHFFPLSYAISMPLTLLTDILVFKEKLKIKSVIGLCLVITSILLINL